MVGQVVTRARPGSGESNADAVGRRSDCRRSSYWQPVLYSPLSAAHWSSRSSAVTGTPSDHLTPSLIVYLTVSGSFEHRALAEAVVVDQLRSCRCSSRTLRRMKYCGLALYERVAVRGVRCSTTSPARSYPAVTEPAAAAGRRRRRAGCHRRPPTVPAVAAGAGRAGRALRHWTARATGGAGTGRRTPTTRRCSHHCSQRRYSLRCSQHWWRAGRRGRAGRRLLARRAPACGQNHGRRCDESSGATTRVLIMIVLLGAPFTRPAIKPPSTDGMCGPASAR